MEDEVIGIAVGDFDDEVIAKGCGDHLAIPFGDNRNMLNGRKSVAFARDFKLDTFGQRIPDLTFRYLPGHTGMAANSPKYEMDTPKTTSELQLGMLIAKAEATLAGANRVSDDLRELTGRIREIETGLSTRITTLKREMGNRLTVLESNDGWKRQRLALYVAIGSIAGTLTSLAKVFGLV